MDLIRLRTVSETVEQRMLMTSPRTGSVCSGGRYERQVLGYLRVRQARDASADKGAGEGGERCHYLQELVGVLGVGEEVALCVKACVAHQRGELLGTLDTFGGDRQSQPLAQLDDCARNGCGSGLGVDRGYQAAIEFYSAQRQLFE